jgi:Transglutaminase-like superfamily
VIARLDPACWRAAWWTLKVLKQVQGDLPVTKLTEVRVSPPPRLPARAITGVKGALLRRPHTCLMRAIILSAWYDGQGEHREIIIGVTRPSSGFRAHAWLEGELACSDSEFEELTRWSGTAGDR